MLDTLSRPRTAQRALTGGLLVLTTLPMSGLLAGCGAPEQPVARAPINQPINQQPQQNAGINTKQKVALLAGAAALYFLYNKFKNDNRAQLQNQQVQYYLSKNGRVYYRDPQTKQPVWVTPPPQQVRPVELPYEQAQQYSEFQGYNRQQTGKTLRDVFPVQ